MKPILIVEDETIVRESLRDWLRESGYEVETAGEGDEALQKIGEKEFDIVILDLRLPGKNGLEVWREARAQSPKLKGIIITAYPSVETAVEAMKIGATDYMVKPFAPDALEKLIRDTLGSLQVEIRPKGAAGAPSVAEKPRVEEIPTITEKEVPAYLQLGKDNYKAGHYGEAIKQFETILRIAPGHIEARVWLRKAREALSSPLIGLVAGVAAEEETQVKECLWMKLGVVSFRLCTCNYDCLTCEFDQTMQERLANGEGTEIEQALERFRALPGNQRACRYALKGDVSYRLCSHLFQCVACEFAQSMDDALQLKLTKLTARREALAKKAKKLS